MLGSRLDFVMVSLEKGQWSSPGNTTVLEGFGCQETSCKGCGVGLLSVSRGRTFICGLVAVMLGHMGRG